MTPAARLSAAIELIGTIDAERVPAAKALKEWGTAHRYAGSGDRAAIAGLIWDVLRRRASSAWIMDADTPRARALGMLKLERKLDTDAIAALCDGGRFAPEPLTEGERAALTSRSLAEAPAHVAGDYPEWLDGHLAQVFGDDRVAETTAMASRAPLDLRVNTLKANREKMLPSLAHLGVQPTPWSPIGLRIELGADARNPGIHAEEDFIKGAIEVQDEGSQLAALLSAAKPGEQVIDLCAGAGGKTLALAAMMQGKGRLIATDHDKRQLAPIYERLSRAGVHNCDVRTPKGPNDTLCRHPCLSRSRADRRALHRHRHLAAQSRRQMADAPRRARGAAEGPGRRCWIAPPRWSSRAGGSPTSPARYCRRKTASRSAPFFGRHPEFRRGAAGADRRRAVGQGRGFCRGRA